MGRILSFLAAVTVLTSFVAASDPPTSRKKSADVVKIKTKLDKADADGKQLLTVTLSIDKQYHLYANPVGQEDFEKSQTTLTIDGASKPEVINIDYPKGKIIKDPLVGHYAVYEGEVAIKATIKRKPGSQDNLEVSVKLQACSESSCLPPATLSAKVESK